MTNPPHGSDEDPGARLGEPDRYPTEPTPTVPPPVYGAPAAYGGYGTPDHGRPPYGPPAPAHYGYGAPPTSGPPPTYGPPPAYAMPPYGPPPAAPPRRSRVGLIATATVVLLLVIAGVVVLVLARRSTVLDAAAVQRDVAAQFEQREGVSIDLACRDTMKVRAGATYTCTGATAYGESVTIKIAITDPRTAAYTWTEP